MKKSCILSVAIASTALLSVVILFVIKSGYVVALNNDNMENVNLETLDDGGVIMDSSVFSESGYSDHAGNITTEAFSMYRVDSVDIIMDYSTVFESGYFDYTDNIVTEEFQ